MKDPRSRIIAALPIIIAIIALAVSIYSATLSRENYYINKTQTIVGKRFEILLLMKQLSDLKNAELDSVDKILWTYQDNPVLRKKEEDRHLHWETVRKRIQDDLRNEEKKQDIFHKENEYYDINILENYVGYYKLSVSFAASSNDFAKHFLERLEGKAAQDKSQQFKRGAKAK